MAVGIDDPTQPSISELEGRDDILVENFNLMPDETLIGLLEGSGIGFSAADRVIARPIFDYRSGVQISIVRAPEIIVIDGGRSSIRKSFARTVKDFFDQEGIELGRDDRVSLALDSPIRTGSRLEIVRVSITELVVREAIVFETKVVDDPDRPRGERLVVRQGQPGELKLTFKVERENGQEVKRTIVRRERVREPIEAIVRRGTKVLTLAGGTATWYKGIKPMSAAHKSLKKGTKVEVVNLSNNRSVVVEIADFGPFGAEIDLSKDAFSKIADLSQGRVQVAINQI